MASSLLLAVPRQEQWTSSVHTHRITFECDRRSERVEREREDPPLPESFTLFSTSRPSFEMPWPEHQSPFPYYKPPHSCTPSPKREKQGGGGCPCYDCIHGHPRPDH